MLQIDPGNIMGVYRRMDEQFRAMQRVRQQVANLKNVPPCGADPVSLDAVAVFQPKIDSITSAHVDYMDEVQEARDRLKQAAQEYGLIEDENTATLKSSAPPSNGPLLER